MARLTSLVWPANRLEGRRFSDLLKRFKGFRHTRNLNMGVRWNMERGVAATVVALVMKLCQSTESIKRQLTNRLTSGTCTVAPIVITKAGSDGESEAKKSILNPNIGEDGLENSRRNETDIGAGATTGTRWVLQSRLDQSAAVTVETAVPWTRRDIMRQARRPNGAISHRFEGN